MNNILVQYQVQLTSPVNYLLYNNIITSNEVMSQIIGDNYTVYDANALLSSVNSVLTDPNSSDVFFYTQSVQLALFTKAITYLYADSDIYDDDNTTPPSYSLPTQDFQVIVTAWRDYLVNSPTTPKN